YREVRVASHGRGFEQESFETGRRSSRAQIEVARRRHLTNRDRSRIEEHQRGGGCSRRKYGEEWLEVLCLQLVHLSIYVADVGRGGLQSQSVGSAVIRQVHSLTCLKVKGRPDYRVQSSSSEWC